jgi:TrmH family RNA methyltransferase
MRMASLITSLQNSRLKALAKLHDAKHRKRERLVLVDGQREILQAILGGVEIVELWFDPERVDVERWLSENVRGKSSVGVTQPATAEVLERLQYGDRNEGMVAVAKLPDCNWNRLNLSSAPLILVLDGVEKPGNIGAVCRTAAATGVDAIILSDCRCEAFNPNAIRSSLGLLFRIPVIEASSRETIETLRQLQVPIFVARVQAAVPPFQADLKKSAAIVLGSEADGLGGEWLASDLNGLRIPMDQRVDSLNVSVSAAILMYEAMRQRMSQA